MSKLISISVFVPQVGSEQRSQRSRTSSIAFTRFYFISTLTILLTASYTMTSLSLFSISYLTHLTEKYHSQAGSTSYTITSGVDVVFDLTSNHDEIKQHAPPCPLQRSFTDVSKIQKETRAVLILRKLRAQITVWYSPK